MANICSTNLAFYSDNYAQLYALHDRLYCFESQSHTSSLVNLATYFGLNPSEYELRGEITYVGSLMQDVFYVDQEDAWAPHVDIWNTILNQYPDVRFVYMATEPGCGIYINTDAEGRYLSAQYYRDFFLPEYEDCDTYATKQDMLNVIHQILDDPTIATIEGARVVAQQIIDRDKEHGYFFNLYEYTHC